MNAAKILIILPCLAFKFASTEQVETRKSPSDQRVLVFGGNGFIGAETVVSLVSEGYQVTIVNRGNWYWDSVTRIKPHVTEVMCDRSIDLLRCDSFRRLGVKKFDFTVDFSGYRGYQVEKTVRALKGIVDLYIYISTDSVYEVCSGKEHDGRTKETDAVRPNSTSQQKKLNELDEYGHEKLRGEEILREQRRKPDGIPYVILRLPDVIGPRDRTLRWWFYQLWVRTFSALETPIYVPQKLSGVQLSFVHVQDVAKVVVELMKSGDKVHDQAFNIAYDENPTLATVLKEIGAALNPAETPLFDIGDFGNRFYLYPSVKRGPVDTTKVKSFLTWRPPPWKERIRQDVEFYETAMKLRSVPYEISDLLERFMSALVPDSKLTSFAERLTNLYGPGIEELIPDLQSYTGNRRDEL